MTLKEIKAEVLNTLKSYNNQIGVKENNIRFGNVEQAPNSVPCVLIFSEPLGLKIQKHACDIAEAELIVFSCANGKDVNSAIDNSEALTERITRIIIDMQLVDLTDVKMGFFTIHSDIAITYVQFKVSYDLENLIEG